MPSVKDWDFLDKVNQTLFANGEPPIDGFIWDNHQAIWMKHNPIDGSPKDESESFDRSSCQN